MAFQVTSAAAREILEAAVRSDAEGMALRVAATATPQGVRIGMGFDDEAPGDSIVVIEGLTVLVAPSSQPWLDDTVLDYAQVDGDARDFVFVQGESGDGGCATEPGGCGTGGCSRCS